MQTITNDTWLLTVGTFLPLVGVLLMMFVPASEEKTHKQIGILTSAVTAAVGVYTLLRFDFDQSEKLQFFVDSEWITVIKSNYTIGLDGISLPLYFLSMVVTLLVMIYTWDNMPDAGNPKSFITLMLVPLLVGRARWIVQLVDRIQRGDGSIARADVGVDLSGHTIVIGAGPAGRSVLRDLVEHDVATVVIEANPATVQLVGKLGMHAVLGNAARPEILREAGLSKAGVVVVTVPDPDAATMVVEQVRSSAPDCKLIVRCRYNVHAARLSKAGADHVILEEDKVGEALGDLVVKELGLNESE